jgi:SAM-dependent methyltransferase
MYVRFVSLAGTAPGRRLLDLGVTPDTRLPDSNFLERWYPHRSDITMASVEDCAALTAVFPGTSFVRLQRDQALPFPDAYFDVGFSSAVLEHVGGTAQQLFFVHELLRTCRSVFLTTPDRTFPIELHTFLPIVHWLPKHLHRWLLGRLGASFWAAEANLNLLTRRELAWLVTEVLRVSNRCARWSISSHRLLGLSSNLMLWVAMETAV